MKNEHESIKNMWNTYLSTIDETYEFTALRYNVFYFGTTKSVANELADLVKNGDKQATTSLLCMYEIENEDIPKKNDISIITDYDGVAQCIIRTKKIFVVPFKDVNEEMAFIEGEGDKSLLHWRKIHLECFKEECEVVNLSFNEDFEIVFEEFELLF